VKWDESKNVVLPEIGLSDGQFFCCCDGLINPLDLPETKADPAATAPKLHPCSPGRRYIGMRLMVQQGTPV
jgi:hypothetical protein